MNKPFHLQYEDVASVDWRTQAPKLNPKFMAISADSHVTEPPEAYSRYLDPKYRDAAPRVIKNPDTSVQNELYVFDGMEGFPFHTAAAAGMKPHDISKDRGGFTSMHKGGWEPKARIEAQDRDASSPKSFIHPTACYYAGIPTRTTNTRALNPITSGCATSSKRIRGGSSASVSPPCVR
jgi:hypothetical protein